jgi:hypothetical protein
MGDPRIRKSGLKLLQAPLRNSRIAEKKLNKVFLLMKMEKSLIGHLGVFESQQIEIHLAQMPQTGIGNLRVAEFQVT